MAFAAAPALDTDHAIALRKDAQLDCLTNPPFQALVNIFLPIGASEVGLGLGEAEGIDATIEMCVARCAIVTRNHNYGADRTIL